MERRNELVESTTDFLVENSVAVVDVVHILPLETVWDKGDVQAYFMRQRRPKMKFHGSKRCASLLHGRHADD